MKEQMIDRGVGFLVAFLATLAAVLVTGCAHPVPYVCQQGMHESGAPVLICQPIDPGQIQDAPARPPKPTKRGTDETS